MGERYTPDSLVKFWIDDTGATLFPIPRQSFQPSPNCILSHCHVNRNFYGRDITITHIGVP